MFESRPLVQRGERTQRRVVDAHYADDLGIDAEDDAMGGVEELVEREVDVVLFGDAWAAGR